VEVLDSRRLTGPNLVWDHPGALLEVTFADSHSAVIDRWKQEIVVLREAAGLPDFGLEVKTRRGGAWLVVGGPIDQLYGLTDLNELAWNRASGLEGSELTFETILEQLREEANPKLLALQEAADRHNVTFLWDDDEVSLGMGGASSRWPVTDLPLPEELDWTRFADIPVAVVTGTNGKSTNVRLLGHISASAGWMHGTTSTDWIRVGNEVVERGDYSGPGGARTLLRDPRVEIAFLETARGGLLRRGTGVNRADVALVTNVAEDHMGQYGIHTVEDLAEAKLVVARLVEEDGVLILNADDLVLVEMHKAASPNRLCWFSVLGDSPVVLGHVAAGGTAYCVLDGNIVRLTPDGAEAISAIDEIPITLGGKATYNVANCVSAAAVAIELGIPLDNVRQGLTSFDNNPETNPGRSNYFQLEGLTVLLDYAHNVHGLDAILDTTAKLNAKRRILTISTAGDRTEHEIRQLASHAVHSGVEEIMVSDCLGYERELGKGGVPRILMNEFRRLGKEVALFDSELESVEAAFQQAQPGDLLILLVKAERSEALEVIQREMALRTS